LAFGPNLQGDGNNTAQFAATDPDHEGTLSRDEYMAVVEMRFNAADTIMTAHWMPRNSARLPAAICYA
jgi:hypothetical protein